MEMTGVGLGTTYLTTAVSSAPPPKLSMKLSFRVIETLVSEELVSLILGIGGHGKGKVRGVGAVRISDHFTLSEVALVDKLGYNLLSVRQLLNDGYEVRFKEGLSRVLDSRGDLVCPIVPFGRVFRIDFLGSGPSRCLMANPSPEL